MPAGRARAIGPQALLALCGCAALALRLAFALGYWQGKPLTHDEQEYLGTGLNLAAGRGFVRDLPGAFEGPSVERFSRAPLYAGFVALVARAAELPLDRLPGQVPRALQVVQSVLGTLAVWLLAVIARRFAGAPAAIVAAALAAVYPPFVWMPAYALSEALYFPLALGAALAIAFVLDADTRAQSGPDVTACAVLAGSVAGLAALTRSAALAFVCLVALALLWQRRVRVAVVMVACVAGVLLPWTVRNVLAHGRPILVAADAGVNFWIGNHPLAVGEGDLATNADLKRAHREFVARAPDLTPEQREPRYVDAALDAIAQHPVRWVGLLARKAFHFVVPIGPSYGAHSRLYRAGVTVPYLLLLPFAVIGVVRLLRDGTPPRTLMAMWVAALLLALVFFPHERYRVAGADPVVVVLAAVAIARHQRLAGLQARGEL